MDDNFQHRLENILNTDDDVLFNWTVITVDETGKEEVLHETTKLWITIRGFSFAKSIIKKYRGETKKRTSKSKGLQTRQIIEYILVLCTSY